MLPRRRVYSSSHGVAAGRSSGLDLHLSAATAALSTSARRATAGAAATGRRCTRGRHISTRGRRCITTRTCATTAAASTAAAGLEAVFDAEQHVVLRAQVAGIEHRRVDHLEGELEILERQARPAGRRIATVAVNQADAEFLQLRDCPCRCSRCAFETDADVSRHLLNRGARGRLVRDIERPVTHRAVEQPRHILAGGEQAVQRQEAVVGLVAEVVPRHRLRSLDFARGRLREASQLGQRQRRRQPIQNAIELDAHLERQRVSGVVVRPRWRRAGIRDVIRMILRLEHVHHVRTKCLRALHDQRARRDTACPRR
jgi:hypothetical protein